MEKANVGQGLGSFGSALGGSLLGKDSLDIDAYVTNKAMDGLFKMVAKEEEQIRQKSGSANNRYAPKGFRSVKEVARRSLEGAVEHLSQEL